MTFSTSRFSQFSTGVCTFDGVDCRALAGGELFRAHQAFAEAFAELKRLYAPLAAQIERQSQVGAGNFARTHGFGSPEKLIAQALGGTLSEARMLIEAGRAALEAEQGPEPGEPDPGDSDLPDGDAADPADPADPTLTDEERAQLLAELERAEREARRREREKQARAQAREAARRAALSPTARALEDGEITADAAAQIRQTLSALTTDTPDLVERKAQLEVRLVRRAHHLSLSELRVACERAAATFDADQAEARARRLAEARGIYFTKQPDGSIRVYGQLDPVTASALMACATDYTTRAFRTARELGAREERTAAQMRADALVVMAEHFLGCDQASTEATTTILVEVSLRDLAERSGVALNHATGTTMFAGDLRRWCAEVGIIPTIMGSASEPLDLGRKERLATPAQKKALIVRDGSCVWCDAPPAWCDAHHLTYWTDGGTTELDNMVLLCRTCHTRIHTTDWTITRKHGQILIIPPPDVDPQQTPIQTMRARISLSNRDDDPPDGSIRGPDPGGGHRRAATEEVRSRRRSAEERAG